MEYDVLNEFAHIAQNYIDNGALEDVLRHYFSISVSGIFPELPSWIQTHTSGTESNLHFLDENNVHMSGFADVVVGKTAVEYEKNLTIQHIFNVGYTQVKEYCAGLLNQGINAEEILGVLSDTVRWHGYTIEVSGDPIGGLYGANNITLIECDSVDLSLYSDVEYRKFERFISIYFDRVQTLPLEATALVRDFGMESSFYRRNIDAFSALVHRAMTEKPVYADLVKSVWQNFVAYLGASDYGGFSDETYINELYLVTVAKVICANVIKKSALISSSEELIEILNGNYFRNQNILNLVDYDYFGWLNAEPYVNEIVECASNMQRQLTSYDFATYNDEDLFGELLAQLANKEHRLLLGQEFTPHWVAHDMVSQILNGLPEDQNPRILDMCCGSGVFLIEAIKAVRFKYTICPDSFTPQKDDIVFACVTGFDIDPLAVMLAKANWVLAMNDLFTYHRGPIVIPIYHADSMFVTTPVTERIPDNGVERISLQFDGNEIFLPSSIITPDYAAAYDSFMNTCYTVAMSRAAENPRPLLQEYINNLVESVQRNTGVLFSEADVALLTTGARDLIIQLERLQREGRNGIWYFILSNSYRPGVVEHQFNIIVSNPPWLAMSKLADNPYKTELKVKCEKFGIQPPGASHLHIELASTFLLSAIDKYLADDGAWACVMPGSILSGYNHDRLRRGNYRESAYAITSVFSELWELPKHTFKNKAIVLFGKKKVGTEEQLLAGRFYTEPENFACCEYELRVQGNRSAWCNHDNNAAFEDIVVENPLQFKQGADIFPRTTLFHEFERQPNGNWTIGRIAQTSEKYYLINDSKKDICKDLVATNFEDTYMYKCFISKHMSPFYMCDPENVIIPGNKSEGHWIGISETDLSLMNVSTRTVFTRMQTELGFSLNKWLLEKINIREKLQQQSWEAGKWLVFSNAGGANPCAAYIVLDEELAKKLVVDQTLYWYQANTEEEAQYIVGLLNSSALAEAIADFQPQGEFGRRHIHTLPYKIMPTYSEMDPSHQEVIRCTKSLIDACKTLYERPEYRNLLDPNSQSLASRRRRQQLAIKKLQAYEAYNSACKAVLGL